MDLKGELKQGALPSLFRNFATENFAGVLTISMTIAVIFWSAAKLRL